MSYPYGGEPQRSADERSTGELVQQASEQITRLVREELALARTELVEKGRHAGLGAGLLGGGGLLALYGLGVLLIALVLGLAEVMWPWLAALIVALLILAVAGGMALMGRRQVQQAVPPVPEEAAQSVRDDLGTVTAAMRGQGSDEPVERELSSRESGARQPTRRPTRERTGGGARPVGKGRR